MMVRQILALFRKDLRAEFREARHFIAVFLFALLLLLIFSLAFSVESDLMRKISPGLFWLAIFFASTLSLQHSFSREVEDGQWEGLLAAGLDPKALYLGKLMGNLASIALLQLLLLPPMILLFDLVPSASLVLVFLLGSLGLAIVGTFYAGLTASLREGPLLLPLLLFPMTVPVLLGATKATELALLGDLLEQKGAWLKLLGAFDTVFLLGSLLCADSLFETA